MIDGRRGKELGDAPIDALVDPLMDGLVDV